MFLERIKILSRILSGKLKIGLIDPKENTKKICHGTVLSIYWLYLPHHCLTCPIFLLAWIGKFKFLKLGAIRKIQWTLVF